MKLPFARGSKAADIHVAGFRTTLLWPLTLDLPDAAGRSTTAREAFVQRQAAQLLKGGWTHVQDQLDHLGPDDTAGSYSELTYFHEFVQHFLFARHEAELKAADQTDAGQERLSTAIGALPAVTLFQRKDQKRLDVCLEISSNTFVWMSLRVARLNLYLLPIGVSVVALEVVFPKRRLVLTGRGVERSLPRVGRHCREGWSARELTLADVQRFNDRFRRAHAPFIQRDERGNQVAPADVPAIVAWHGRHGSRTFHVNEGAAAPGSVAKGLRSRTRGTRAVPPFEHFSWLLGDASSGWRIGPRDDDEPSWSHMADDRLPILTTIVLSDCADPICADYARISPGDWARLCFVDPPGSDPYPYARAFIERDWSKHSYDRFHFGEGESTDQPSRFLIAGYALTAVGYGGFFKTHTVNHMRRHYFQLMLLAQIERAVLLTVSGRISRAVAQHERDRAMTENLADSEITLETALQQVEHDFLQYVHRFRFTGVSDQVQPTEIYAMLRARMGLPELYADIKDELTTATAFLALRSQQREAESAARLSVVATFGVILGLAFSFLGMNVIVEKGLLGHIGLGESSDGAPTGTDVLTSLAQLAGLQPLAEEVDADTEVLAGGARLWRAMGVFFGVLALSSSVGLLLSSITGSPRRGQDTQGRKLRRILWGMVVAGGTLAAMFWFGHDMASRIFRWS